MPIQRLLNNIYERSSHTETDDLKQSTDGIKDKDKKFDVDEESDNDDDDQVTKEKKAPKLNKEGEVSLQWEISRNPLININNERKFFFGQISS